MSPWMHEPHSLERPQRLIGLPINLGNRGLSHGSLSCPRWRVIRCYEVTDELEVEIRRVRKWRARSRQAAYGHREGRDTMWAAVDAVCIVVTWF